MAVLSLDNALTKVFTERQQAFICLAATGIDLTLAAEQAGYAKESAKQEAWRLLREPTILAAVQIGMARELAQAAPIALRVLREFTADETVDKRIRLAAAKTLLDRAGFIAPKASTPGRAGETPLNEMTMGELRTLADKLEGEIAGRAKEVSSAKPAPKATQAIDDII